MSYLFWGYISSQNSVSHAKKKIAVPCLLFKLSELISHEKKLKAKHCDLHYFHILLDSLIILGMNICHDKMRWCKVDCFAVLPFLTYIP